MLRRLLIALGLLLPGCAFGPYAKHDGAGPDARLAALVDLWRTEREQGDASPSIDGHIVVDPQSVRQGVESLALEYPSHAPTLFTCALMARDAGDTAEAESYLDLLASSGSMSPEAAALRARLDLEQGDLPAASTLLEHQLRLHPSSPELHEAAAELAWLSGRVDETHLELDAAEHLGAPAWRVAYNLGLLEEADGQPAAAITAYKRALQARPDFATAKERLHALEVQGAAAQHSKAGS